MGDRRWDGDTRGAGVADGRPFAPQIEQLLDASHSSDWVAEQPEAHLLEHLRGAARSLPFEIVSAQTAADGSFDVELRWTGEPAGVGEARAAVFAVIGRFACA